MFDKYYRETGKGTQTVYFKHANVQSSEPEAVGSKPFTIEMCRVCGLMPRAGACTNALSCRRNPNNHLIMM